MKFRYLFSVLPVMFIALFFAGCGVTTEELVKNNLAEMHNHYFTGATQHFNVAMWSGVREEPFEQDGIRGQLVDFCVLHVVPIGEVGTFGMTYKVKINDKTYEGEFGKSPFDNSLAADLETSITDTDEIYAEITFDGVTEVANLSCISCDFTIDGTEALNIAVTNAGEVLMILADNGNKSVEGYLRIISTDRNLGVYFWYVRFINVDGEEVCLVIDTNDGSIMASKL